jgi:hypothetical protein
VLDFKLYGSLNIMHTTTGSSCTAGNIFRLKFNVTQELFNLVKINAVSHNEITISKNHWKNICPFEELVHRCCVFLGQRNGMKSRPIIFFKFSVISKETPPLLPTIYGAPSVIPPASFCFGSSVFLSIVFGPCICGEAKLFLP